MEAAELGKERKGEEESLEKRGERSIGEKLNLESVESLAGEKERMTKTKGLADSRTFHISSYYKAY